MAQHEFDFSNRIHVGLICYLCYQKEKYLFKIFLDKIELLKHEARNAERKYLLFPLLTED